jgi:5-methylcytosine-specific restriction endonuclease McrA
MTKKIPNKKLDPCGSWGAYKRHLRKKEKCQICLDGEAKRRRAKGIPKAKKAKCGENSASYKVHIKNNEPICDKCKELKNAHTRKKYQANKVKRLARQRELHKQNLKHKRELIRRKGNRRRALKLNNGFDLYTEKQVLDLYGTDCHICKKPIDLNTSRQVGKGNWEMGLHIDHIIPISKGGADILNNVKPAHAYCNISKGAK